MPGYLSPQCLLDPKTQYSAKAQIQLAVHNYKQGVIEVGVPKLIVESNFLPRLTKSLLKRY